MISRKDLSVRKINILKVFNGCPKFCTLSAADYMNSETDIQTHTQSQNLRKEKLSRISHRMKNEVQTGFGFKIYFMIVTEFVPV